MNSISDLRVSTPVQTNSQFLTATTSFVIAVSIIAAWMCHLGFWLSRELISTPIIFYIGAFWVQVFLNTGLFITAHDAIHGLVYPQSRTVNYAFGVVCATLYAFLPYGTLVNKHQLHHQYPMSAADPDFSDCENTVFVFCYLRFMRQYWGWKPFIRLTSIVCFLTGMLHTSLLNLILFWALPLLLSSIQLFYFGTYRPHQCCILEKDSRLKCAPSQLTPWFLSLLSCYHFSYHYEHHAFPNVPWWLLPKYYLAEETEVTPFL